MPRREEIRRGIVLAEWGLASGSWPVAPVRTNLSFTASAYQAAGGFSDHILDEDVALMAAFHANAEPIAWALDLPVRTSARRNARVPGGFASYLIDLEAEDCVPTATSPAGRS